MKYVNIAPFGPEVPGHFQCLLAGVNGRSCYGGALAGFAVERIDHRQSVKQRDPFLFLPADIKYAAVLFTQERAVDQHLRLVHLLHSYLVAVDKMVIRDFTRIL